MYTEPVDIRYYPPQHVQFRKKAYEILKEFTDVTKWSQYGPVGFADIIDIAREDEFGTAILTTDMPYASSELQVEELGEVFDIALPGGSDNALFLFGLPKNAYLEASGFELMTKVCSDNLIAGFFESEIEEPEDEEKLKVVCICTLKHEDSAAKVEKISEEERDSAMQKMLQEAFYRNDDKFTRTSAAGKYSLLSGSEENHYISYSGKLRSVLRTGYKKLRIKIKQ